jgi:hypothetical protein
MKGGENNFFDGVKKTSYRKVRGVRWELTNEGAKNPVRLLG